MKKILKFGCLTILGFFSIVGGVVVTLIVAVFFLQPESPIDKVTTKLMREFKQEQPAHPAESNFEKLKKKAVYDIDALDLLNEYTANEFSADAKYKGKIVLVRGRISNMHTTLERHFVQLELLDFVKSVQCQMQEHQYPKLQLLSKGQNVQLVGKVEGLTFGITVDIEACLMESPN